MKLNAAIMEDGFGRLTILASDGKTSGAIRGLRGGRVRQLLSKLKITTNVDNEGYLVPVMVLDECTIEGDFSTIKKGQPYKYSVEDIARFAEQGLVGDDAIVGRRELNGVPEPVQADVEYIASEDGFRCTDIRNINLKTSNDVRLWMVEGKFRYVKPSKGNSNLADLAASMEIGG